jgi:hypothetical protein
LAELNIELQQMGGLRRQDHWRRNYYRFPYMVGSPFSAVRQRFIDTFINSEDMNAQGQIIPRMDAENNYRLSEKWAHALEEIGMRGGIPLDTNEEIQAQLGSYYSNGRPTGQIIFDGYESPATPILVKYSKRKYLQDMLRCGMVRICPASSYSASMHNYAIRDSELTREFIIPTFRERLRGETQTKYEGRQIVFGTSDLVISVTSSDFYAYCLSDSIYYRLPDDFDADAALVIRDPRRFVHAVRSAFRKLMRGFRAYSGPVDYYDPYTDYGRVRIPEMCKHFRYSYQREYRIAFIPGQSHIVPVDTVVLNIGSMVDYADLRSV